MTLAFRYAVRSHVGLVRENNEDSGYAGPHLLMVADGMGGVAGGEVASAITIDVVKALDRPDHTDPLAALSAAAAEANLRIARRGKAEPRYDGMGTTLTAGVLFDGSRLGLLHIGDSRAYLLRDGDLTQITKDHTFVQSLVDDGRLTEAQARVHPHRALIIRVLDGSQDHKPDLKTFDLRPGDRLLFCSDGTEDVSHDDIAAALLENPDPGIAAGTLIRLALRSGTSDNVTCVVADVVEEATGQGMTEPVTMGAASEVDLSADSPVETTADQGPLPTDDRLESTSEHAPVPAEVVDPGPDAAAAEHDDEELRYAPRPPRRFRWLTRTIVAVGLVGVLVVAAILGYDWTQQQYFVGAAKESGADHVAIYRGIAQDVPGVRLSSVEKISPVLL
ncbi:MAG TPA: protein phosphatase 2C domain-containing protein, partial [Actinopolymorphaceae bacterium]